MRNSRLLLLSLLSIGLLAGCKSDDPAPTSGATVSSTNPANNATGIALNNAITISFSEEMDPTTINSSTVIVKQGTTVIPGTLTYADKTAIFKPTNNLLAMTVYTVTITSGAKTVAGKSIAQVVSTFTTGSTIASRAVVNLRTSANYVILAKTAINNSPTSSVTGALGLSPAATSYITGLGLINSTGYATSSQVTGHVFAADMAAPTGINLTTAIGDMQTAYTDAAGRTLPDFVELATGNIGGKTLAPGLYKWTTTVLAPTSFTISGSATDVWIFQISKDLTFSSAVNITLAGGALAKNIFWQVAGAVSVGTTAHVEGIFLSKTGITFKTGSSINGRALAQTAVILDGNAVVEPQ